MAKMNFGGVIEEVMTREEFPLEKAREVLKNETIAVLGYGVQGPGQACNLRDNGFNVIVGQRAGKTYDKAVADGWVPGETLFSLEEAAEKGTIVCMLLSDAAQMQLWSTIKPHLTTGKTLYFSHGFAINWPDRTGVVPPAAYRRHHGSPEGLRHLAAHHVPRRPRPQLVVCHLPGPQRQSPPEGAGLRHRHRLRLHVETTFKREATSDLTGDARFADGRHPGTLSGTV